MDRSPLQALVRLDRIAGGLGGFGLPSWHFRLGKDGSPAATAQLVESGGDVREQCGLWCVAVIRSYVIEIVGIFG
ncbi:hypothetical protein CsSME_00033649 [Camellia sinensis var. sinensis]